MRWLQAFSKARHEGNTTLAVTPVVPVELDQVAATDRCCLSLS